MLNYISATIISGTDSYPIENKLNTKFILNPNKNVVQIGNAFKNLNNALSTSTYLTTNIAAEFNSGNYNNINVTKYNESTALEIDPNNTSSKQSFTFRVNDVENVVNRVYLGYDSNSSSSVVTTNTNIFVPYAYTSGFITLDSNPYYNKSKKTFIVNFIVVNTPVVFAKNYAELDIILEATGNYYFEKFFRFTLKQ